MQAEYIVEAMAREGMRVYSDHMTVMVLLRLHHTHFLLLLSRRAAHTAEQMSLSSFHVYSTMCALALVCCTRSLLLSLALSCSLPFSLPLSLPFPLLSPLSLSFTLSLPLSPPLSLHPSSPSFALSLRTHETDIASMSAVTHGKTTHSCVP